jgi:ankyrin repeat protein
MRLLSLRAVVLLLGLAGTVAAPAAQRPVASAPDGTTPLHDAVLNGDQAAARTLVGRGADVNARNRYGVAPLTLAARNGDAVMLDLLLGAGADPRTTTGEGETALMTAARTGVAEAVRVLIRRGADVNAREGWLGETALMWAAAENHAAVVRLLVEAGASLDARSAPTNFAEQKFDIAGMLTTYLPRGEWTALMYAARENAIDAARILVEAKADIDARDPDSSTPLVIAAINTHYDLAALLVDNAANPNIGDTSGMTPLYAAVDMNTPDTLFGRPLRPSQGAVDAVELVRRLLRHGANPNAELSAVTIQRHHTGGNPTMGPGTTPIMRAAKNGDIALVRLLLEHGADIKHAAKNGTTVLMAAAQSGTAMFSKADRDPDGILAVAKLCLELGVDPNATNERGQTAVHLAAAERSDGTHELPGSGFGSYADELIRILAAHGARLDVKDNRGLTPLDVAKTGRNGPRQSTIAVLQTLLDGSTNNQ